MDIKKKSNNKQNILAFIFIFIHLMFEIACFMNSFFMYGCIIISFIILIVYYYKLHKNFQFRKDCAFRWLILFLINGVLGLVLSFFHGIPNYNIQIFFVFFLNILTYYFLIKSNKIDNLSLNMFFNYLMIFGVFLCIYNILKNFQIFLNFDITFLLENPYEYSFSSIYGGRNLFAFVLLLLIFVSTMQLLKYKKWIYFVIWSLFLTNLLITFSRSALLSLGIFLASLLFLTKGRSILSYAHTLSFKKKCIYIVFILILLIWMTLTFGDSFIKVFVRPDYGSSGRAEIWGAAFRVFRDSPIFGYGMGSTEYIFASFPQNISTIATSFHNTYIELLLNGGLVLLFIFYKLIKYLFDIYIQIGKEDSIFSKVMISSILALLIYNFFESSLFFGIGNRLVLLTLLFITIPVCYNNYLKEKIL